jgi:hypothetical protein
MWVLGYVVAFLVIYFIIRDAYRVDAPEDPLARVREKIFSVLDPIVSLVKCACIVSAACLMIGFVVWAWMDIIAKGGLVVMLLCGIWWTLLWK